MHIYGLPLIGIHRILFTAFNNQNTDYHPCLIRHKGNARGFQYKVQNGIESVLGKVAAQRHKFISQESGILDKNKLERNAVLPKQRIYSKDFENRYYGTSLQRKMRLATHFTWQSSQPSFLKMVILFEGIFIWEKSVILTTKVLFLLLTASLACRLRMGFIWQNMGDTRNNKNLKYSRHKG